MKTIGNLHPKARQLPAPSSRSTPLRSQGLALRLQERRGRLGHEPHSLGVHVPKYITWPQSQALRISFCPQRVLCPSPKSTHLRALGP